MASLDETSPLLAKPVKNSVDRDSISYHDSEDRINDSALPVGPSKRRIDEESQEEEAGRASQYEGLPEVKKQLKFIVPAVAVGVRQRSIPKLYNAGELTTASSCSLLLQIRPLWQAPMVQLAVI